MAMRKTKSGHGSGCGFDCGFSEKKNPETYPCTPFSLVAFRHCNDRGHYNDINRPSGANNAFRDTRKVSCPTKNIRPFFSLPLICFSR